MSEKAVAIGHYFVASGIYVVLGHPLYVEGSENVTRPAVRGDGRHHRRHASNGSRIRSMAADKILAHIEKQARCAATSTPKKERKMYDMKSRRELQ